MLNWPAHTRVFACTVPTDMRKQFDGLHSLVTAVFGRDVFDGHLFLFVNRRREETLDVPETGRVGLGKIGEDVAERLEFDPPKPWVRRIVRPKYARPGEPTEGVRQAPPPLGVIEGGRYGFSVVIEVLIQKYLLHMPLYRQQNLFAQCGWTPSRSTLCQIVATPVVRLASSTTRRGSWRASRPRRHRRGVTLPRADKTRAACPRVTASARPIRNGVDLIRFGANPDGDGARGNDARRMW